jgi:hypothetical protein
LDDHPGSKQLPVVVPMVVHHSATGWTAPATLADLLDADAELIDALGPHIPQLCVLIDDLSQAEDSALQARSAQAVALAALRLLVWARHSPDLSADLRRWRQAFDAVLAAPNGVAALSALVDYTLRVANLSLKDLHEFVQSLGPGGNEAFMTAARRLIEEGIEQGIERGEAKIVLHLLGKKFGPLDDATIERVRAAGAGELELYAERVLTAETLAEVLG